MNTEKQTKYQNDIPVVLSSNRASVVRGREWKEQGVKRKSGKGNVRFG